MSIKLNNYLKVLHYLKEFEGDGQFHEIEQILDTIDKKTKRGIFKELENEGWIVLTGGAGIKAIGIRSSEPQRKATYRPHQGKLTLKGTKYLKEELQMQKGNIYNISVKKKASASINIESPNAKAIIEHRPEILEKVNEILNTVKADNSISEDKRDEAILIINQLMEETKMGLPAYETYNKMLTVAANISSIISMVAALAAFWHTTPS